MNINYFFPVFRQDDIKEYLTNFKDSNFFKSNSNYNFVFVCEEQDENNLKALKEEVKIHKKNKLITLNKPFTYNDAFKIALEKFNADIVLLGDTKVNKIDLVFEKCLEKYKKKVSVVHIIKRKTKFKGFCLGVLNKIYNFFIKIFTDKLDRLNVTSLGLIDKDVIDILKVLPNKCCFLKNTKNILGFETRTIYIPPKTITYKLNYKAKTGALIASCIGGGTCLALITFVILINCLVNFNSVIFNIIGAFFILITFLTFIITLPKHFFDIRNYENRKVNFNVKEIN